MFILTTFSDLVQIPPHEFSKRSRDEVEDKINEKYANKVVQNVGFCMCMYDLLKASDGLIGHGTGNVNVNVEFRMIVFRPFKNEVILGKISKQDHNGMTISTEFFEDIVVPANMLFSDTTFDETEGLWIWTPPGEQEYVFEFGDRVRVRVEAEVWKDQAPTGPQNDVAINGSQERRVPYAITASMAEGGLGPVHWW